MTDDSTSRRQEWLAKRREVVTASDVAAILGEDPRRGPLAVYAQKVGEFEADENLPMRRGRRFESAIADEYSDQTGRPVLKVPEYELLYHPDIPWLAATLDRKVLSTVESPNPYGRADVVDTLSHPRAPLQIKMALGSSAEWRDGPPVNYEIQVTIEMACAGSTWGALCGMVGPGPLKEIDLPRNDSFLRAVFPKLEEFHQRVRDRRPPDPDAKPGTTEAIKRLWAGDDGETIGLDREALNLVTELEQGKRQALQSQARLIELDNRVRTLMGNASFGALNDGSFLVRRRIFRKGFTVDPTSYISMKRWWPKIRNRREMP